MIGVSNSLDPDQVLHFVRPALGPNWLQRLSADDTGKSRVESDRHYSKNLFKTATQK